MGWKPKKITALLIDYDDKYNDFRKRCFKATAHFDEINVAHSGKEALDFLYGIDIEAMPEIIMVEINTEGSWEFLDAFLQLDAYRKERSTIIVHTESHLPRDEHRARQHQAVTGFSHKHADYKNMIRWLQI